MLTTLSPAVATEGTVPHRAAFDLQKWPETVREDIWQNKMHSSQANKEKERKRKKRKESQKAKAKLPNRFGTFDT